MTAVKKSTKGPLCSLILSVVCCLNRPDSVVTEPGFITPVSTDTFPAVPGYIITIIKNAKPCPNYRKIQEIFPYKFNQTNVVKTCGLQTSVHLKDTV